MMPPGTPDYLDLLYGILPGHGPTVYVYTIGIYSDSTISPSTITSSQNRLAHRHFNNTSVVIGIIIFALIPIYNMIRLTVPNLIPISRFNSTHNFRFNPTQPLQLNSTPIAIIIIFIQVK